MKPFWKSRTIIMAAAALVFLFIDFFTGAGISETANQALNQALIGDPEIKSVNFIALLTLIATIIMRIITKSPIKTGNPERDKETIKKTVKKFLQVNEAFRVPIIDALSEKRKKEIDELLKNNNNGTK